jgi:hypothetical protein
VLAERAYDFIDAAGAEQILRTAIPEAWIETRKPFPGPGGAEHPFGLGEDELQGVDARGVDRFRGMAVDPPRDRAALDAEDTRELCLPAEVAGE